MGRAVTDDEITYTVRSSSDLDPKVAMIAAHIKYGRDEWRVTSEASPVPSDVVLTPLLHTVHLARYVFKEFGIDGATLDMLAARVEDK